MRYTKQNPRFNFQDLDEEVNIPDLQKWVDNRDLIGIVDEKHGGIIGYINYQHENEFYDILNKTKTN